MAAGPFQKNQMDAHHGQKRQQSGGGQHRKHIAAHKDDVCVFGHAFFLGIHLKHYGQGHKRQTVKRAADNKERLGIKHRESARYSACFVVRGFQRGFPFGTRLCLQSVVCYTCWRG